MDSIVWTGSRFLYVQNTDNTIWAAPAAGSPVTLFASMLELVEETRCVLSPGTHGWPDNTVFCHSPDNKIYEFDATSGASHGVFATLPVPYPPSADGALAFDEVGHFGYQLVAATGKSGAPTPSGGVVYTISSSGKTHLVGSYPGPGGADELLVAPAGFGSAAGDAVLTVDPGQGSGTLVALDPEGHVRILEHLDDGPNPEVTIEKTARATGDPPAGFYVTDDQNGNTYFTPAAPLERYAGDLLVGSEVGAHFWIVAPKGDGYTTIRLRHNLRGGNYALEGAVFVP